MRIVEPIRDLNRIQRIKGNLKRKKNPRDLLLFTAGINLGLRISDLLRLKVEDVKDRKGDIRDFIYITEQKTKKQRKIALNEGVREALQIYFDKSGVYDLDQYLFLNEKSRENKPLTRVRAWQLINEWCREVGIKERMGTHTLRKTLGYQMRKKGIAIEIIQAILGHSSAKVTSRYIGISDDELEEVSKGFIL
ncbi:site-specific integrase [Candidatus Atribacteria bacterium 1244-E10-H5-B2]|nr:MAG: site-specific integrase [Candidatus Atribacteria bacterium 1244-E10-H5-B2]